MAKAENNGFLDGKLLIAMPGIGDPRFERSVIFMCAHSADGAMGIVINKVAPGITFSDLLERLDLLPSDNQIKVPVNLSDIPVQFGGPVETGRGFVLHTTDYYSADTTLPISERVGLTATLDVLRAIAKGEGPRRSLLALGYSGWGPGQLEGEIQRNGWLHCDADEELLFKIANDEKYTAALKKIGIDLRMLSSDAGHA
ncbi:MAG TPA: YqgE/AlgH family protein [Aestuariivirgaceae bacterium]|nr:YqgE/AlgH family protein [Aestuariivirgaceae bacterium]